MKPEPLNVPDVMLEYTIDGRPYFAKHSVGDVEQVKIAAIDPDFYRGRSLCP